jgi:predicted hydrolase (HD superfamily)
MATEILKETAIQLLIKYNKNEFHIRHAITVENVMFWFANKLGYEDESNFWSTVGLLHDIDFEIHPTEHCVKAQEILKSEGLGDNFIHAVCSHGYGLTGTSYKPDHEMEKILFAVDELTGLIGAAAIMRPSKSVSDMELKSLKKKFKDKKFAAGCSREVITQGAEILGWELDKLLFDTLEAMRATETKAALETEDILKML